MRKIESVIHPYVYTDDGYRFPIQDVKGQATVGALLDNDNNVVGSSADSDCVNGVCPIK